MGDGHRRQLNVFIRSDTFVKFRDYCDKHGFKMKQKVEDILVKFLEEKK